MNYLILNLVIFNRIISEIIYAPASARGYFPLPLRPPSAPSSHLFLYPRVPLDGIETRRRFFSKSSLTVPSWIIAASAADDGLLRVEISSKTQNSQGSFWISLSEFSEFCANNFTCSLFNYSTYNLLYIYRESEFLRVVDSLFFCNNWYNSIFERVRKFLFVMSDVGTAEN